MYQVKAIQKSTQYHSRTKAIPITISKPELSNSQNQFNNVFKTIELVLYSRVVHNYPTEAIISHVTQSILNIALKLAVDHTQRMNK